MRKIQCWLLMLKTPQSNRYVPLREIRHRFSMYPETGAISMGYRGIQRGMNLTRFIGIPWSRGLSFTLMVAAMKCAMRQKWLSAVVVHKPRRYRFWLRLKTDTMDK